MFRYQILIEYEGTNFRGRLKKKNSKKRKNCSGIITRDKISKLLKEKIIIYGAGRLDVGVHAKEQSAHFDCKNKIIKFDRFVKSTNHFLNIDGIAILKIKKRNNDFHARFSAKMRVYNYVIFNRISGPVLDKNKIEAGIL